MKKLFKVTFNGVLIDSSEKEEIGRTDSHSVYKYAETEEDAIGEAMAQMLTEDDCINLLVVETHSSIVIEEEKKKFLFTMNEEERDLIRKDRFRIMLQVEEDSMCTSWNNSK